MPVEHMFKTKAYKWDQGSGSFVLQLASPSTFMAQIMCFCISLLRTQPQKMCDSVFFFPDIAPKIVSLLEK